MSIGRIAERLTAKRWTQEIVDAYVGECRAAFLAYASEADVRDRAASGGAVSATLIALLEAGEIEGALVCQTAVEDGRVRARYVVARTRDEVLAAQGSTYVLGNFVREALPLLREASGRMAVVGLPCDIEALRRRPELDARVAVRIALFCGHTSNAELVDAVVERLSREAGGAALTGFRFRSGHWRGRLTASFADGTVLERPSGVYNLYQNLYFGCARKCLSCGDHFGYAADLSMGDVWLYRLRSDSIKYSAVIVKTRAGEEALRIAIDSGALTANPSAITEVLDGQRRVAPFHYNVSARSRAGRRLGVTIPDTRRARVRWHEAWAARIVVRNALATQDGHGLRKAMARPGPLLKAQLLFLKGLESLS